MLTHVSALIFDLDGTISDPSLGISRCINHALAAHQLPQVSSEAVAALIGPPLDTIFKAFLPDADAETIASLIASYRQRYAEVGYAENELYTGMAEAVTALAASGLRLGVCTSKRKDFAEKILDLFCLLDEFCFVDGGDVGIDKSQQLSQLLHAGLIDKDAVMVGDRAVDIHAAHTNGLRSVGVLWGFGSAEELSAAQPQAIVHSVEELVEIIS